MHVLDVDVALPFILAADDGRTAVVVEGADERPGVRS